jgi:hypothetical protein
MKVQSKLALFVGMIILAAILSNGNITGLGKDKYVDYRPKDGEHAYDIQIGSVSTLNLAQLRLVINGRSEEIPLHGGGSSGNGHGIFVRGFMAVAGTTISMHVERTGHVSSHERFGTINCYVRENGDEVSAATSNDPYIYDVACAWVVGAPHPA